jgi:hypothetical protein
LEDSVRDNGSKNHRILTGRLDANHLAASLVGYGIVNSDQNSKYDCSVKLEFTSDPIAKATAINITALSDLEICQGAYDTKSQNFIKKGRYKDYDLFDLWGETLNRRITADDCGRMIENSHHSSTSDKSSEARPYALDSNRAICAQALNRAHDDWETAKAYEDNVKEAKFRKLSVSDCRVELWQDNGISTQTKVSEPEKVIIVGWRRQAQLLDERPITAT